MGMDFIRSFREFIKRVLEEMLAKIRRKIRCGIGTEGDDSSAYPRFTLRSRIIYCKLGNIRKKLRLLLMI